MSFLLHPNAYFLEGGIRSSLSRENCRAGRLARNACSLASMVHREPGARKKWRRMMPARMERGHTWFAMPLAFARDPKLLTVPPVTRYLFLELVALSLETSSCGRVDAVQLSSCGHGMRGLRQHCGLLMDALLLSYDQEEDAYYILDGAKWLEQRPQDDPKATVRRPQDDPKATSTKSVSAGQNVNRSQKEPKSEPRVGARVEQTDRPEEGRTPSGSVRPSSAQAAPRVAGGAAQPALENLEDPVDPIMVDGRRLRGSELIAYAKAEVEKGRAKNKSATGIDTKFSKYDPDRPIVPITSALRMNGNEE